MNPTRSYIVAFASITVAWFGFCFHADYINTKADVVLLGVTIVCVVVGAIQAARIEPTDNIIKEVAPITIAGLIGIVSSIVGIWVV